MKSQTASKTYYGYAMLAMATLSTIATSPGQTYLVAMFHKDLLRVTQLNITELSTAYMFGTLCSASLMTFVGRFSDRYGPRFMIGIVAFSLGWVCLGMRYVQGFWSLLLGFFLLRFFGQGSLGLLSSHTVALWFEKRLGFVESIRHGFLSIAMFMLPPLVTFLIKQKGWKATYMILGVACWSLTLPGILFFFRNTPEEIGQHLDGDREEEKAEKTTSIQEKSKELEPSWTLRETVRTPAYWILTGTNVSVAMVVTGIMFQIQPLLAEQGIPIKYGAYAISSFSMTAFIMMLCTSWIVDRLPVRLMLFCIPCCVALGSFLIHYAHQVWHLYVCMGVLGCAGTFCSNVVNPTVARYFGRTYHGAIRGSIVTITVAGTSIGPVILGYSKEYTGSFRYGLMGFVAYGALLSMLILFVLKRPQRKV